jgi:hypothetical protein
MGIRKPAPRIATRAGVRHFIAILAVTLWICANIIVLVAGAWGRHNDRPRQLNQAYSAGVQLISGNHLTPGPAVEILVLISVLASLRWLVIQFRIFFDTGPVEVRPLSNASGRKDVNLHELDVNFREYLTLPRLYQVTTIPGDPDPDQLIEVLRSSGHSGWREFLAAAYAYALPRRAFVISATLRMREHQYRKYGVSVLVKKLPGYGFELESQWSSSFDRALQRAAYAVGAYILPHTRQCRNVPWSEWRGRTIPVSLFRDYQRAKRMVRELRYDEALALYHRALLQDADNFGFRYDIGQLYERLGLYPDALYYYLRLVNEIFPVRTQKSEADPRRSHRPEWWPEAARDPFFIRYRYVVVLSQGALLAHDLCLPDWERLRRWLDVPHTRDEYSTELENRPWRATELKDMQKLLSAELDLLYPSLAEKESASHGGTLMGKIYANIEDRSGRGGIPNESAVFDVERYFLSCAANEADSLVEDFTVLSKRQNWRQIRRRKMLSIVPTSVRMAAFTIDYRLRRLDYLSGNREQDRRWPIPLGEIESDLEAVEYDRRTSTSWLEHYNAACIYALALVDDNKVLAEHEEYAVRAVAELELALKCGEDVDFVRAKRYWLQAGDPDLVGLRKYECFRAFAGRIYGRPLPTAADISKYELYLYLRALIEIGARRLEDEWRKRATRADQQISYSDQEDWWRQEQQAWELAIRLGRFYRQWQTRRSVVVTLRSWMETFGGEVNPVTYPDINRPEYMVDITGYEKFAETLAGTERIFECLADDCGRLRADLEGYKKNPLSNARSWAEQARADSRSIDLNSKLKGQVAVACRARAGLWAALRHWANIPEDANEKAFRESVTKLMDPPGRGKNPSVSTK